MKEIFLDSPYLCFFFAIFVVAAFRDIFKAIFRRPVTIAMDLPPLKKPAPRNAPVVAAPADTVETGEDPKAKN